MSGNLRFKVNCFHDSDSERERGQEIFKNLYDFLNDHPNTTLISLYYGTGDIGDGNGTNYHDEANSFADGSFAVFRFEETTERPWTYEVLIQYLYATTAPGGNASPLSSNWSSYNSQIRVATSHQLGPETTYSTWNGGTAADGTDAKGTPVWALSGSGTKLLVNPYDNSTGQTYATNKESANPFMLRFPLGQPVSTHFIADDDGFLCFTDFGNTGDNIGFTYYNHLGIVYPFQEILTDESNQIRPLMYISEQRGCGVEVAQGSNNSIANGRATGSLETSICALGGTSFAPGAVNPDQVSQKLYTYNTVLTSNNTTFGYAPPGHTSLFKFSWGLNGWSMNSAKTQLYLGLINASYHGLVVPWDPNIIPLDPTYGRSGVTSSI